MTLFSKENRLLRRFLYLSGAVVIALSILTLYLSSERRAWTFAFYLAGDNSLAFEQQRNFMELIRGNRFLKHPRVVVFYERGNSAKPPGPYSWKGPAVFHLNGSYQSVMTAPRPKEFSGNGSALSSEMISRFFSYVRKTYPADHYAFFITGHGNGRLPESVSKKGLSESFSVSELKKGLEPHKPDILSLDLCLMGDYESISQLKDSADYLLVSQGLFPAGGQDYESLLKTISEKTEASPDRMADLIFASWQAACTANQQTNSISLIQFGAAFDGFDAGLTTVFASGAFSDALNKSRHQIQPLPGTINPTGKMTDLITVITLLNQESELSLPATFPFIRKQFSESRSATGISFLIY